MRFFTCDLKSTASDVKLKYYVTSKISENIHETPEGFLVCIGVPIARTGEMIYGEGETPLETDDSGQIKINRSEDEVFHPDTMASFEGKPITITHPEKFVGPENWGQLAKGILQNVRRGEGDQSSDLIADLLITDRMAIALVKNGLREVSCGYEADYIQTEEGKGIQTKIIGNHLALVDRGRAGSAYAINDHKGASTMKLSDKIKAIFAKAQDEAMKAADCGMDEKPDEKKDEKKTDDAPTKSFDELVKVVKDLSAKFEASMGKQKDAESPAQGAQGEVVKNDEEMPAQKSMEDRMAAIEAAVTKLLEAQAMSVGDEDKEKGEEKEKAEDEESEEGLTGDAMEVTSRAEILAPGIKHSKDVKVQALKAAYATKEGKKVIDALTGGKAPTYDSAEKVDTLFIAASELLKVERAKDLSKTKTHDYQPVLDNGPMTAEKLNEINAKYYKRN